MDPNLIQDYRQRTEFAKQKAAEMEKLINRYSLMRLLVFALFIVAIVVSVQIESYLLFMVLTIILAVVFAVLIRKQSAFEKDKYYYQNYEAVCQNELNNITSHSNIYSNGAGFADEKHPYSSDLDIYGPASLYQLLNRAATPLGRRYLAGCLHKAAGRPTILQRQEAVKELAAKNDWKLDIQALLLFANKEDDEQLGRLLNYLKAQVTFGNQQLLNWYIPLAPYFTIGMLLLSIFLPQARYAAIVLLVFNGRLTLANDKTVRKADLIAGKIGESLAAYADVFESIEKQQWESPLTTQIAAKIKVAEGKAISVRIRELGKLVDKLNQRLSVIMAIVLNGLFVWNIRQVMAIEQWKRENVSNFDSAFEAIAYFETLLSLASLHINYPEWYLPEIVAGEGYTYIAKGLGHPLIVETARITNDYELTNTHKIDIITGSNMAGKSTFLRTLGINAVLALAGAPVCASEMKISVIDLISYMRIKDSLNESTSTFKAELDRLQMLLNAVNGTDPVFFLIDEMLRGTNSADKYLGSKAVIERLISKGGVGLVATHDLQIAQLEQQYPDYIRNFYFDIQVVDGEMLFDYKLKPGECKTFNASMLLKKIGIEI